MIHVQPIGIWATTWWTHVHIFGCALHMDMYTYMYTYTCIISSYANLCICTWMKTTPRAHYPLSIKHGNGNLWKSTVGDNLWWYHLGVHQKVGGTVTQNITVAYLSRYPPAIKSSDWTSPKSMGEVEWESIEVISEFYAIFECQRTITNSSPSSWFTTTNHN